RCCPMPGCFAGPFCPCC
uniref:Conotoxin Reg12h n=2 Tax=Conus regius TaxID=101314 RepID=CM3CH_CONRE|nr:RecName: Full=Conotoxin Reg12h [Conus regius]